jgi:hypothetical protein
MNHTPSITYKNNKECHEYCADGRPLKNIKRVEVGKELKSFILDVDFIGTNAEVYDRGHRYNQNSIQFFTILRDEMFLIPCEITLSKLLSLGFFVKLIDGEFSK